MPENAIKVAAARTCRRIERELRLCTIFYPKELSDRRLTPRPRRSRFLSSTLDASLRVRLPCERPLGAGRPLYSCAPVATGTRGQDQVEFRPRPQGKNRAERNNGL